MPLDVKIGPHDRQTLILIQATLWCVDNQGVLLQFESLAM
jgi:hypothetical protein